MAGIIKNNLYQNMSMQDDEPVMTTVYGSRQAMPRMPQTMTHSPMAEPAKPAANTSMPKVPQKFAETQPAPAAFTGLRQTEYVSAEEAAYEREQLEAEYEAMRASYEKQSEQYVMRAREKADEIYQKTKAMAEKTILEARQEADKIKAAAAEEGRKQGFEEGSKQGYDDGYMKALKKCKDSLLELKTISEEVTAQKSEIFMKYERQLFDAIFEIAQKITVNSLNQHDKGVITKMLREAGKKMKASKSIKITLSKLDMDENAEIDEELLKDIFKSSENVEIEVLSDAPKGTLILDNGSEITDAGVATQLEIIEQLGSGKYRDKSFTEMLRDTAVNRNKKPKADDDGEDAVPDVAYKNGSGNKN